MFYFLFTKHHLISFNKYFSIRCAVSNKIPNPLSKKCDREKSFEIWKCRLLLNFNWWFCIKPENLIDENSLLFTFFLQSPLLSRVHAYVVIYLYCCFSSVQFIVVVTITQSFHLQPANQPNRLLYIICCFLTFISKTKSICQLYPNIFCIIFFNETDDFLGIVVCSCISFLYLFIQQSLWPWWHRSELLI